jgi:hypothetical protein
MYCYYQDQHARPGGVRFVAPVAVGVCHQCGVAVCADHAHKDPYPGAPMLCYECAKLQATNESTIQQSHQIKEPEFA